MVGVPMLRHEKTLCSNPKLFVLKPVNQRLSNTVCGLLGASRVCGGAARLVPAWAPWGFALGSAALYFVLLAVTQRAFQRQPTTELVLFVAWLGMEVCSVK